LAKLDIINRDRSFVAQGIQWLIRSQAERGFDTFKPQRPVRNRLKKEVDEKSGKGKAYPYVKPAKVVKRAGTPSEQPVMLTNFLKWH
jgi:hypothetical protein